MTGSRSPSTSVAPTALTHASLRLDPGEALARGDRCPAGGGIAAVRTGPLAFWAGGSEAAVERARPVLAAIGDPERLRHCGPVGSGLVVKLLNNYLVAVNAAASGEALALAREAGVDVRTASGPSSRAAAEPTPNSPTRTRTASWPGTSRPASNSATW
ncbi:NAD-binding protein [Streptomyces sp. ID05-18]|uniref:NAD-binding protein n=1 Tax=Streptomyces sp. ID05-18 TaxID=3028662 RepID=UPI0029A34BB9|nr:NAD-binding protein [Streptomyces sp. ID05-18]MDX3483712.1 NAD-binding protein [Streptomyces sp. ID05-18]